jgi:hypothetical protein
MHACTRTHTHEHAHPHPRSQTQASTSASSTSLPAASAASSQCGTRPGRSASERSRRHTTAEHRASSSVRGQRPTHLAHTRSTRTHTHTHWLPACERRPAAPCHARPRTHAQTQFTTCRRRTSTPHAEYISCRRARCRHVRSVGQACPRAACHCCCVNGCT